MSKHLKQMAAPRSWALPRKTRHWTVKPSPGAHPEEMAVPLSLLLRDYMGYCETLTQARMIIGAGEIIVDGRKIKDYRLPVGLMDVVSVPKIDEHYRMLIDRKGKLRAVKIPKENSSWKLCRIENKTTIRGGKTQLNLHDGRCILVEDAKKYSTGDTIKIELPSQNIVDHFPLAQGSTAMIIGGVHNGEVAKIDRIEVKKSTAPNLIHLIGEKPMMTIKSNVFVIGKESPVIKLPEVSIID